MVFLIQTCSETHTLSTCLDSCIVGVLQRHNPVILSLMLSQDFHCQLFAIQFKLENMKIMFKL